MKFYVYALALGLLPFAIGCDKDKKGEEATPAPVVNQEATTEATPATNAEATATEGTATEATEEKKAEETKQTEENKQTDEKK
ncbi:MAG: hypothetical protein FWG02_03665 [Holophagaceae bacterium]|nr:hypothetical protein [Holophagaceae bacterium]